MTYSTDHLPDDSHQNRLARLMNAILEHFEADHDEVSAGYRAAKVLCEWLAEQNEIEEAAPIQHPVCSPDKEDRV